ncbi:MAG: DUF5615 family PIN-like protein [Syntrophaceae bacterium]|nr:DUF5615 family PIN-like protein [Syntrophaceae bacterium]
MNFLFDMPLSPELAVWLVQQGHNVVHAIEAGLDRATDAAIIEYAHNESRIILTADLDYPRILTLARAEEPGLILFRGGNYNEQEAISRLTRALETIPSDEFSRSIVVIEKLRIRRRRLPIKPNA